MPQKIAKNSASATGKNAFAQKYGFFNFPSTHPGAIKSP
jgi:hypothetical protein